jgi:hypothetical protein
MVRGSNNISFRWPKKLRLVPLFVGQKPRDRKLEPNAYCGQYYLQKHEETTDEKNTIHAWVDWYSSQDTLYYWYSDSELTTCVMSASSLIHNIVAGQYGH